MGLFHAVVLGVIQGVTEFLPISSSGHLVIFQSLFGIKEPQIFFDITLHVGTLAAVCVFFSKDLKEIAGAVFSVSTWFAGKGGLGQRLSQLPEIRLLSLIIVGTIPTALLGLAFRPVADVVFSSVWLVGITLLVTGLLLWFTRGLKTQGRNATQLTLSDGRTYACEVIDISISGAAVKADIVPSVGTYVMLGKMRGRVTRIHDAGIGIEFVKMLENEQLDNELAR